MTAPTKIFLADLAHTASVADASLPIPLSIGYLKAYAVAAHGDSVDIRLFKHPEKFLAAVAQQRPDIIGFANYTWNERLNLAVGRHVRKLLPGSLIVAGGPNIDAAADRQAAFLKAHDYLDLLIIDGGEEPFGELIDWRRKAGGDKSALPRNIVWLENGKIRSTPERKLERIIENIPSPYLSGILDEFIAYGMVPMFESNRGCPFACTFCGWGSASKDLVRRLDLDTCLAEIKYVGERSTARNWIVCDANFGILPRDIEIAKAIRRVRDEKGLPQKCHTWLAKNVTDRNLEIGAILGDMTVPVMALQSMDDEVLEKIKRDNISKSTYVEFQQKFHKQGSKTYSDLIVPLPAETLTSHEKALRDLFDFDVDIITNHNVRLLAGSELNSDETRRAYGFKTRYRLIHGDAGAYRCPDGSELKVFEYEESTRATTTMSEDDLFHLRRLHFLVDFAWNNEAYRPLLKIAHHYGVNQIDVFLDLLKSKNPEVREFFAAFDKASRDEWFDSAAEIEAYFADDKNFNRLLNQEFDKLNILFSVRLLRDCKPAFDEAILGVIAAFGKVPDAVLEAASVLAFALFPPLHSEAHERTVDLPANFSELTSANAANFVVSSGRRAVGLLENPKRGQVRGVVAGSAGQTLSKILNTQQILLSDLRLDIVDHDAAFRRAC